ncbi:MAG TPA: CpsD/CapB family tyrosine-protein kinase [Vicinamibacterales bacterium]|nr:CpsD/CapB family tyrosine-protein kinase [Vicinamibacterales bacterium]
MSRIHDALQRSKPSEEAEKTETEGQLPFRSAWSVAGETPSAAEAAPRLPAEAHDLRDRSEVALASQQAVLNFSSVWRERLALGPTGNPHLIEQFRRLAATLHRAHRTNGLKSVMVTSAMPGDGKTLTAINLALVLAESYRYNVLLVDADLRRPSIPSVADLGDGSGLSEVLRAPTQQKLALVPVTSRLTLLPAGQPVANSIEALTSPRMRVILEEATARYDWVILDAPPVGPAADARLLTEMVGGTLFVIRAGQTQHADIQGSIDSLGREHILGVVLNGVLDMPSGTYEYGYQPRSMD